MTTGLIQPGMSLAKAVEVVRGKAIEYAESSGGLGLHTEIGHRSVLIGLARRGKGAMVLTVDKAEYDGQRLAELLDLHG